MRKRGLTHQKSLYFSIIGQDKGGMEVKDAGLEKMEECPRNRVEIPFLRQERFRGAAPDPTPAPTEAH